MNTLWDVNDIQIETYLVLRWILVTFGLYTSWIPVCDSPFSLQPPGWITESKCMFGEPLPPFKEGDSVVFWDRNVARWERGWVTSSKARCIGAQWMVLSNQMLNPYMYNFPRDAYYSDEIRPYQEKLNGQPPDPTDSAIGPLAGSQAWLEAQGCLCTTKCGLGFVNVDILTMARPVAIVMDSPLLQKLG
jgi:hypothetical protein